MFKDPKDVTFSSKDDVITYVSGGFLPPLRDDFDRVMEKVRTPDPDNEDTTGKIGRDVVILESVLSDEERKVLDEIMTKVYKNRVRNRNRTIKGALIVLGAVLAKSIASNKKKRREEKEAKLMMDSVIKDWQSKGLNVTEF